MLWWIGLTVDIILCVVLMSLVALSLKALLPDVPRTAMICLLIIYPVFSGLIMPYWLSCPLGCYLAGLRYLHEDGCQAPPALYYRRLLYLLCLWAVALPLAYGFGYVVCYLIDTAQEEPVRLLLAPGNANLAIQLLLGMGVIILFCSQITLLISYSGVPEMDYDLISGFIFLFSLYRVSPYHAFHGVMIQRHSAMTGDDSGESHALSTPRWPLVTGKIPRPHSCAMFGLYPVHKSDIPVYRALLKQHFEDQSGMGRPPVIPD
jgi:hypothetical protein